MKAIQAEISSLQNARGLALKDIARKFPLYGNLVNPPPPVAADLQKQLADDEALLSFYFGRSTVLSGWRGRARRSASPGSG